MAGYEGRERAERAFELVPGQRGLRSVSAYAVPNTTTALAADQNAMSTSSARSSISLVSQDVCVHHVAGQPVVASRAGLLVPTPAHIVTRDSRGTKYVAVASTTPSTMVVTMRRTERAFMRADASAAISAGRVN